MNRNRLLIWLVFGVAILVMGLTSCERANTANEDALPVSGNELALRTDVSEVELDQIAELKDLEVLELYRLSCPNDELAQCLAGLTKLRRLRLQGITIGESVLESIALMQSIEVLNIPDSSMTDEQLGSIAKLPKLQLLRFGSPHVSDDSMPSLAEAQSLRFLHFLNVPVTDDGLRHLHGMHHLESLYIDGGNETEDGIRALLKANPDLHFHRNQLHIVDDPNADQHDEPGSR